MKGPKVMNIQPRDFDTPATREEAADLLARLRNWAATADAAELNDLDPRLRLLVEGDEVSYPVLDRVYPEAFKADAAYVAGMPDLQNGPASLIRGARRAIQHVGISNFRLPIRYRLRDGGEAMLETSVTGTVSLEAEKKGINMSRIMRSFYEHVDETFGLDVIERAVDGYKASMDSFDARIQMRFSQPLRVESMRSGLSGYQYYDVALELIDRGEVRTRVLHLDYVYASTCPCSLELSEHARQTRGQLATPHSQRSVARISVVVEPDADLLVEDMVDLCRGAVPTETQVMVKREDEQAFAELNAANPIFVEDAARLFAHACEADPRIGDFRIVASHQESLHSHDAVSILTEGETFDAISIDPRHLQTLVHAG